MEKLKWSLKPNEWVAMDNVLTMLITIIEQAFKYKIPTILIKINLLFCIAIKLKKKLPMTETESILLELEYNL